MARINILLVSVAACALQGCGGGDGMSSASSGGSVAVVPTPAPSPSPTPTPTPTPAPTPTPSPTPIPSGSQSTAGSSQTSALPPLDLSDMKLWNYAGHWHASQWDNPFGALAYRYDHVVRNDDGSVDFVLDMFGAPELQAQTGQGYYTSGMWEVDVTLPEMRDGLVVAPLWLYNNNTKEEFDIEFAGRKGLDLTIHAYPGGVHKKSTERFFAGQNWSGRRVRFAIRLSVEQGWAEILVDGKVLKRFEKDKLGYFGTRKFKPVISMWAAAPNNGGLNSWLGQWQGIAPGDKLVMTVHGYRYTPLKN